MQKASAQLHALCRLRKFLSFKAKSVLIQSFVFANFNYCPLVWHFSSSKSLSKVEIIHRRALRFLLDDNDSSYEDPGLEISQNKICGGECDRCKF